jgi:hypothetical protein
VGDAARELAHGLELLRLPQRSVCMAQLLGAFEDAPLERGREIAQLLLQELALRAVGRDARQDPVAAARSAQSASQHDPAYAVTRRDPILAVEILARGGTALHRLAQPVRIGRVHGADELLVSDFVVERLAEVHSERGRSAQLPGFEVEGPERPSASSLEMVRAACVRTSDQ